MHYRANLLRGLILLLWLISACVPNNAPLGPDTLSLEATEDKPIAIDVSREGVFVLQNGQRVALSAAGQVAEIEPEQGIAVDENGRAILRFGDQMTLELLRGAEIPQIRQLAVAGQGRVISVAQNGGTLIADLTVSPEPQSELTVQTAFATISAANTRFAVVREANSPLEWILGLETGENGKLEVTTGGAPQTVAGGQARWVTSMGEPGASIVIDQNAQAWLEGARNNVAQPELGEILMAPANILADGGQFTSTPRPGRAIEFGQDVQGAVSLTLDPQGIFGAPTYTLEDCNGDGVQDLAIKNGALDFDFRPLLARVVALDITVLNRDRPGYGLWQALDPSGAPAGQQQVSAAAGETETLSLRDNPPYHTAKLTVGDACFMGISLTPPSTAGKAVEARPVVSEPAQKNNVVVNVLAASAERLPQNGQFKALPVSANDLVIDAAPDDWNRLAQQNNADWLLFSAITHNSACSTRYPDSENQTDLAGQVLFAYNNQNLYVAFVVDDDGLVTYTGGDDRIFLGDAPQLLLDLDLNGDFDDTQLSGDDAQIDILPNVVEPQAVLWNLGTLTSSQLAGGQIAVLPADTGYFLEAAIPWSELGIAPQPGDRLGIVASINDNDTPDTNVQECIISTSPQRDWRNPATWGTILLAPTGN